MAVVRKGPSGPVLEYMLACNHDDWIIRSGSLVRRENGHPVLAVSINTHEVTIVWPDEAVQGPGGAYPLLSTGNPVGTAPPCGYLLVGLEELWARRNDIGPNRPFNRWGYFNGKGYHDARAPWVWEYHRIGWLADPARMMRLIRDNHYRPEKYLNNPYND